MFSMRLRLLYYFHSVHFCPLFYLTTGSHWVLLLLIGSSVQMRKLRLLGLRLGGTVYELRFLKGTPSLR